MTEAPATHFQQPGALGTLGGLGGPQGTFWRDRSKGLWLLPGTDFDVVRLTGEAWPGSALWAHGTVYTFSWQNRAP